MEYISQPDKASIQFVHIVKNIKILFRMPTQSAVWSVTFSIRKKIWKTLQGRKQTTGV